MGWKEGKGIGALMSKRQLERHKVHEMKSRGIRAKFDEEGVKLFEEMAPDFAFAPENIPPVYFSSHEGTKGLGYRGLEASSALDQRKGFNAAALQKKKGGKGIRGQAFGVGVFEEDDEDIYTNFDMTQYDFELGQTKGPKDAPKSDYTFVMAEKRLNARKFYDAPKLPAGFRAVHKPVPLNVDEMPDLVRKMGEKLSVTERARFLGDRSASVMELLPDAERKKLENWNKKPKRKSRWDLQKVEPVEEERRIEEHPTRENKEEVVEEQHPDKVSPFAEDPLKEHRFHQYRLYLRRGLTFPQPIDMTELEWDREVEEFQKYLSRDERDLLPEVRQKQVPLAANLAFTAPLAEMLKSRFTSATHEDANSSKKRSKDSDRLAAVKSKMFGPLTRQQFEWYPVKNLCKLFNVPDPYPYSSVQGVMHLQKRPAAATARIEDIALLGVGLPNTQNELKSKEAHPPFVKQERRKSEKEKALEDEDDIFSDDDFEDDESDVEDDTESGLVAGPSLNLLQAIFGASDDEIEEEEPLSGGQTRPEKRLESLFDDDEPRDSRPSPKPSVKAAVSEPSKKKFVSVLEMRELDEEFGPLPPPNLVPEPESEEDETRKSSKKHKKEKKHKKHKKNKKESKEKKEKKHKKEKKRRRSRSTSNSYESQ
ncbi:hypothetical protein L596_018931 [Steinernema carpocapsae]|nr:hypothetical protein L596_018931 [Steinernema carpocapsae]